MAKLCKINLDLFKITGSYAKTMNLYLIAVKHKNKMNIMKTMKSHQTKYYPILSQFFFIQCQNKTHLLCKTR